MLKTTFSWCLYQRGSLHWMDQHERNIISTTTHLRKQKPLRTAKGRPITDIFSLSKIAFFIQLQHHFCSGSLFSPFFVHFLQIHLALNRIKYRVIFHALLILNAKAVFSDNIILLSVGRIL